MALDNSGGTVTYKSESITTQGLGSSPDVYAFGWHKYSASDANLNQGSTTVTIGSANVSYAAHAYIVSGGAGTVDSGVVGLRLSGTSITDGGTRTTSDTETLLSDITDSTAAAADTYIEGGKWLGTVTFELFTVSGSPTTFSFDFNYGLVKYEDFGNRDFTLTDVEVTGLAGASDNDFNVQVLHHRPENWTYSAAAFTPIQSANTIVSLGTDHSTDDKLASGDNFSYKRSGLTTVVDGNGDEGIVVAISSSANNAVEYGNVHIGVQI